MFKKILIANRGEIACRVIKTARRMGIATVAVYSEADRDALFVELADEAVPIGAAASRESYLSIGQDHRRLQADRRRGGASGLRLLSENEESPGGSRRGHRLHRPEARLDRGDGRQDRLQAAGREARGLDHPRPQRGDRGRRRAVEIARRIGYRYDQGLRRRRRQGPPGRLRRRPGPRKGFASCRNEAKAAFGDDRVFIEKFVEQPRHIEIQVLGDAHGNCVYLWERECSIQRRHQKVVEEAPSALPRRRHAQGHGRAGGRPGQGR
jgi:propionyl-CoA carboxylase alpha chain